MPSRTVTRQDATLLEYIATPPSFDVVQRWRSESGVPLAHILVGRGVCGTLRSLAGTMTRRQFITLVMTTDISGMTAVHHLINCPPAASREMVAVLGKCAGALIFRRATCGIFGRNIAHYAVMHVRPDLCRLPRVRQLVSCGDDDGMSPLLLAIVSDDYATMSVFLDHLAESNDDVASLLCSDNRGVSALELAILRNACQTIRGILKRAIDRHQHEIIDRFKQLIPMVIAMGRADECPELIRLLLSDSTMSFVLGRRSGDWESTTVHHAVSLGHVHVLRAIYESDSEELRETVYASVRRLTSEPEWHFDVASIACEAGEVVVVQQLAAWARAGDRRMAAMLRRTSIVSAAARCATPQIISVIHDACPISLPSARAAVEAVAKYGYASVMQWLYKTFPHAVRPHRDRAHLPQGNLAQIAAAHDNVDITQWLFRTAPGDPDLQRLIDCFSDGRHPLWVALMAGAHETARVIARSIRTQPDDIIPVSTGSHRQIVVMLPNEPLSPVEYCFMQALVSDDTAQRYAQGGATNAMFHEAATFAKTASVLYSAPTEPRPWRVEIHTEPTSRTLRALGIDILTNVNDDSQKTILRQTIEQHGDIHASRPLIMNVRPRGDVLETMYEILNWGPYVHCWDVHYQEEGASVAHGPGVVRDLCRRAFLEASRGAEGVLRQLPDGTCFPRAEVQNQHHLFVVARIIRMCIERHEELPVPVNGVLVRYLCGFDVDAEAELRLLDPDMHRNMYEWLRDVGEDEYALVAEDWTYTTHDGVALVPRGDTIPVRYADRMTYARLYARFETRERCRRELETMRMAFSRGVDPPHRVPDVMRSDTVVRILNGRTRYTWSELRACGAVACNVPMRLLRWLDRWCGHDPERAAWVVWFATGTRILPTDAKTTVLTVCMDDRPTWGLPRAQTCFRKLFLPGYSGAADLARGMDTARAGDASAIDDRPNESTTDTVSAL